MSSYPTPQTPNTIQTLFQSLTITALGITPGAAAFGLVRVGWQQLGQPAWKVSDDVAIVTAVEEDDQYNRVRDVKNISDARNWGEGNWGQGNWGGADDIVQLTTYTRVWRVSWTLYGPNSFDRTRILKSSLYQQASHDTLAAAQIYLVTDVIAPQRAPEYFEGQWWERVDFSCRFNEQVQEVLIVSSVASVEIIVNDAASSIAGKPLADITVQGD